MKLIGVVLVLALSACGRNVTEFPPVPAGPTGPSFGISVSKFAPFPTSSICDMDLDIDHGFVCQFIGGTRTIYYPMRQIRITGLFRVQNHRDVGWTDTREIQFELLEDQASAYGVLFDSGIRNGVTAPFFLSYTRSPEKAEVFFDSNDNGLLDPTDELIRFVEFL